MKKLSHIDSKGKATMVDVSEKEITTRTAEAYAEVKVSKEIFDAIKKMKLQKEMCLQLLSLPEFKPQRKQVN